MTSFHISEDRNKIFLILLWFIPVNCILYEIELSFKSQFPYTRYLLTILIQLLLLLTLVKASTRTVSKTYMYVLTLLLFTLSLVIIPGFKYILSSNNSLIFNIYGIPASLIFLVILFNDKVENLIIFIRSIKVQAFLGLFIGFLVLLIQYFTDVSFRRFPTVLLYGLTGLLLIKLTYKIKVKYFILIIGIFVSLIISLSIERREDILYILLTLSGVVIFVINNRWFKRFLFFILIIISFLLMSLNNSDIFDIAFKFMPKVEKSNVSYSLDQDGYRKRMLADSRIKLKHEFVEDMDVDLIWGRGITGTYNSQSVSRNPRNIIEMGYYQIILRGGIILLLVYIYVALKAISLALNKSNNRLTKIFAFLIICHLIIMYWARISAMDSANLFFWLLVGFSLSPELRYLNDEEIQSILTYV